MRNRQIGSECSSPCVRGMQGKRQMRFRARPYAMKCSMHKAHSTQHTAYMHRRPIVVVMSETIIEFCRGAASYLTATASTHYLHSCAALELPRQPSRHTWYKAPLFAACVGQMALGNCCSRRCSPVQASETSRHMICLPTGSNPESRCETILQRYQYPSITHVRSHLLQVIAVAHIRLLPRPSRGSLGSSCC